MTAEAMDDAADEDDPKAALIALIVAKVASTPPEGTPPEPAPAPAPQPEPQPELQPDPQSGMDLLSAEKIMDVYVLDEHAKKTAGSDHGAQDREVHADP